MGAQRRQLAGYRLHDRRIGFSGGTGSVRTIKYELKHDDEAVLQEAIDAVHYDNLHLYGITTFDDYLDYSGRQVPNIIDFWLEALALGGVFASSADSLKRVAARLRGKASVFDAVFEAIDPEISRYFDRVSWISFFTTGDKRNRDENALKNNIIKTLKDPENIPRRIRTIIDQYVLGASSTINRKQTLELGYKLFGLSQFIKEQDAGSQQKTRGLQKGNEKLTFIILPLFNSIQTRERSRTEVFLEIDNRFRSLLDRDYSVALMGIEGKGNAFSNFLNNVFHQLIQGRADELVSGMRHVAEYNDQEQREVKRRLDYLSRLAQEISDPLIAPNWAEYRTEIISRLKSFTSNQVRHEKVLKTQLPNLAKEITDKLRPKLHVTKGNALDEQDQNLFTLFDELERLISKAVAGDISSDLYEVLRLLVTDTRIQLNQWVQANREALEAGQSTAKRRKDTPITVKTFAPQLTKELQRIGVFFGDAQLERFAKAVRSKELYREQSRFALFILRQLLQSADRNVLVERKMVESFRRFSDAATSAWGRRQSERIAAALGLSTFTLRERERFYLSGFERVKFSEAPYDPVSLGRLLDAHDWPAEIETILGKTGLDAALDAIELLKRFVALLTQPERSAFTLSQNEHDWTPKQWAFLEQHRNALAPALLNFFTQTLVGAELRGLVAIMSRTEFISRSAIQGTNGSQATLVISTPNKDEPTEFQPDGTERFHIALMSQEPRSWEVGQWFTEKSKDGARLVLKPVKKRSGFLLDIASSKYQVQFLRWFLKRPKQKQCDLSMQGSFTIAERTVRLDWSGDRPRHTIARSRLFASIPFTLIPPQESYRNRERERYLGVDIGEFGLAWCVIECDGQRVSVIANGMIQDSQQQSLKIAVEGLRSRQRQGTFGMPSTHVQRLRESLVGSFRNQIHALALRYDAIIGFEYNVSAFETGGARIKKVYDSVKRSDAWSNQTDETKSLHKQAWGQTSKGFVTAKEVGAGGTSQTCTKCRRWFSRELPEDAFSQKIHYDLTLISGYRNLYEVSVGRHRLTLFWTGGLSISGDKLKSAVYAFMRPPEESEARAFASAHGFASKSERGNSAVFICPFAGCGHVTDADIQAAFTIALRACISHRYGKRKDGEQIPYYEKAKDYSFTAV